MTEKLPTRLELMAEMQAHADYIINGEKKYGHRLKVLESGDGKSLMFWCGESQIGKKREYQPELVAPAKWEPVFDKNGKKLSSLGMFNRHGILLCVDTFCARYYLHDWCCVNNRDHHSEGWKREWEPNND